MQIGGSVGGGGCNDKKDVYLVQVMLNVWRQTRKLPEILEDGKVGPETVAAIRDFQKTTGWVDGRIDVGGRAWRALSAYVAPYLAETKALVALGIVATFVSDLGYDDDTRELPVTERYLVSQYSFRQGD
jgi:peptidoglycan hydrolase-like protein with peptidoglycan-binding domain